MPSWPGDPPSTYCTATVSASGHDLAHGVPAGHAFADLDQLVGIAGAGEPGVDGLRVVPVAVQQDPVDVVESRRHLDPPARAEHPSLPGAGLRSEATAGSVDAVLHGSGRRNWIPVPPGRAVIVMRAGAPPGSPVPACQQADNDRVSGVTDGRAAVRHPAGSRSL